MEVKAFAPGKVILHGEHSVVYGTKAIAISVGLNTKVTISKSINTVNLKFGEVGIDTTFTLEELDDLRNLLKTKTDFSFTTMNAQNPIKLEPKMVECLEEFVSRRALIHCKEELISASKSAFEAVMFLYLAFFEKSVPIEILVTTDLPVGAGLGSSASFGVALTGALLVSSGRMKKHFIDRDMVNRWAFTSECFVHGTPSGIDNSVATFGGAVEFQKGHPLVHLNCTGIRVLLVNTEVPRSTKDLVARCAAFRTQNPTRHEAIMQEIHSIVESVIDQLKTTGQTTPDHVARNQELLKEVTVSHAKIDKIVEIANSHKLSAKLTGAGGGGCVFVLIPPGTNKDVVDDLKASLIENNLASFWDITLGGEGFGIE